MGNGCMRALVGALMVTSVAACASSPSTTTAPEQEPTTDPRPRIASAAAPFDVHEWGLVRAEPGDVLNAGAVAPRPVIQATADKPVLYFHPDGPMKLDVRVRTPRGSVLEAWPPPSVSLEREIAWRAVGLDPHATNCSPSPLPTPEEAPCSRLPPDTECESARLGALRTDDAACVRYGDNTEQFLFYRARLNTFTPPLRFTVQPNGDVEVENDGPDAIPGMLVRIVRRGGVLRVTMAAPPGEHTKSLISRAKADGDKDVDAPADRRGGFGAGARAAVDAIRKTLGELGLTGPEIEAFVGAWTEPLFGGRSMAYDESDDGIIEPMVADSVLYFLPPAAIDAVAALEFEPPARSVKRAFAVWSTLRSSGSSR